MEKFYEEKNMHALLVYAHLEPTSFTGALKDTACDVLRGAGHTVEVSDLYSEKFNPVAGRHDFTGIADPRRFHYQTEQDHAQRTGGFSPELVREQRRFLKAELVVWLYPIWWGGMPAILKGWFDRVLAYGFAYADGRRFDTGFFRNKRGMLCLSTGGTHLRPIATLEEGVAVTYDVVADFAVLCANCHRMIHRTDDPSNLSLILENVALPKT
jgi:NAD(P)H dehydrogenase (quinone)